MTLQERPTTKNKSLPYLIFFKMIKRKYDYFIGVDVSRNKLDYAVINDQDFLYHRTKPNTVADITAFLDELRALPKFKLSKALFVMEYTGLYCNHILEVLKKSKVQFAQESAMRIKNSSGLIRGKHDKIDAIRIANYACKNFKDLHL